MKWLSNVEERIYSFDAAKLEEIKKKVFNFMLEHDLDLPSQDFVRINGLIKKAQVKLAQLQAQRELAQSSLANLKTADDKEKKYSEEVIAWTRDFVASLDAKIPAMSQEKLEKLQVKLEAAYAALE